MTNCCYCGNAKHAGIEPQHISAAEAKQLWSSRPKSDVGISLASGPQLTARQCEMVMRCWNVLPGNFSWSNVFSRIMRVGSEKVLSEP